MSVSGEIREIPISRLIVNRKINARRELGDISELKDSIAEVGLLQPLIVRPSSKRGYYEIVVGRRRYEAIRQLINEGRIEWRKVRCIVRHLDDAEALALSLSENLQRGDLTEDEIKEAIKTLYEEWKRPDLIALRLGVKLEFVQKFLTIAEILGKEVKVTRRPGRWREKPRRDEVPVTILVEADKITETITKVVGRGRVDEEKLRREVVKRAAPLKQKQVQYVKEHLERKLSKVDVNVPDKVVEIALKEIEEVGKRLENRKQVTILIDRTLLSKVRALAKDLNINDDDVIECAVRFSLERSEFVDYLKSSMGQLI